MTEREIILSVRRVKKYFPVHGGFFLRRTGWVHAVDDVSFDIVRGETLGLVGESGCGKSTLGRCIMALYRITSGDILFRDSSLARLAGADLKAMRLKLQMIFQDPFESLNARHTIGEILKEKYLIHGRQNLATDSGVTGLLEKVGLSRQSLTRFPHEFSGGQRQRIGIARAISLDPDMIVCDEPVSALDVSVQSQILNLLLSLQQEMGLTYLFISHDLSVVRHMSHRIAVMYLGRIVEMADAGALYGDPKHPYTQALMSAIPIPVPGPGKKRIILKGDVPSPITPPPGCRFHTRCPVAQPVCREREPEFRKVDASDTGHYAACHLIGSSAQV